MIYNIIVLYLKWRRPTIEKFGVWARQESDATEIAKSVDEDINKFATLVISFISKSIHIPTWIISRLSWIDTLSLYQYIHNINSPAKLPILAPSTKKDKPIGWDYPGRTWNYWSHLIAAAYGWNLDYIERLDTNVALAHIQEILTDEQLKREFIWSTTEIAYPYNPTTKQSKFSPLERPYWMAPILTQPKKVRILKSMMPVGNIQNLSGME